MFLKESDVVFGILSKILACISISFNIIFVDSSFCKMSLFYSKTSEVFVWFSISVSHFDKSGNK